MIAKSTLMSIQVILKERNPKQRARFLENLSRKSIGFHFRNSVFLQPFILRQRLYTLEEDKLIINYIVKNERYDEVRGKSLWVDIQDKVLHSKI